MRFTNAGPGRGGASGALDRKSFLKDLRPADLSVCGRADSFLQSGFWGAFKARSGWKAFAFVAEWGGGEKPLLVLHRSFPFLGSRGFSLAYIPWGPELPRGFPAFDEGRAVDLAAARNTALTELAGALKGLLPNDTVFIRFDPPWYSVAPAAAPTVPPPFIRAGADIQAPDTVLIDLNQPMESIMDQMKPKWRYNSRLALKKGVTVRRAGAEEIEAFYGLLKETARRDGIAIHGIGYYRALLETGRVSGAPPGSAPVSPAGGRQDTGSPPDIRLYLAEHEGGLLAGIVTLFRGDEAVYLYGASSDKKRNFMAPNALQVKALEDAKASGCGQYDLFGIPPDGGPSHPMAGLYQFKIGFGGRIIHRPGSWDYPCRPFMYRLFRCAETLRKHIRTIKKKSRRNAGRK